MSSLENIFDFFSRIPSLQFTVWDFFDILLVTAVIFLLIKWLRETRAFQLVKGLALLGISYIVVYEFNMQASTYLLRTVFKNIFIILLILFQPEIRHAFELMGTTFGLKIRGESEYDAAIRSAINEIVMACERMSETKTGALIVMERDVLLGDIVNNGTGIDAVVTQELIGNIFFPKSPLHDGAAVIRQGRLCAAGCYLPLTSNHDISTDLGTRHRAALGLSEVSDAIIVVVSEETGIISIAQGGSITRSLTESELREKLLDFYDLSYLKPTGRQTLVKKVKTVFGSKKSGQASGDEGQNEGKDE
ncbi:MAG: diadenylate cyclase CdaA [Clostridiales bacterium]|nr:diadenylate cyclase CdaA [Clostridiales bacterium]